MKTRLIMALLALAAAAPIVGTRAQQAPAPDAVTAVVNGLTFRNIGPFRTAAWVTEVAVPETPVHDHLYTIYAATRSGGLWKTVNAGTTWTNITDGVGAMGTSVDELVALRPGLDRIDPEACRARVERHFTHHVMAEGYLRMFRHFLADGSLPPGVRADS